MHSSLHIPLINCLHIQSFILFVHIYLSLSRGKFTHKRLSFTYLLMNTRPKNELYVNANKVLFTEVDGVLFI